MYTLVKALARSAAIVMLVVSAATAQDYPTRPITLVLPYPPGASTDQLARMLQPKLEASLGQPIVVENRGGGGGNIGTTFVARAAPDGYTILLATNAIMTITPHLIKSLSFDPVRDFAPIATGVRGILGFAVHRSVPANSMAEFITFAKAARTEIHYGTAGIGSPQHLAGLALNQATGINLVHVPYKGGGPAINDLLGGHLEVGIATLVTLLPHAANGGIKILAIGEKKRFARLPQMPTISETVPDFEATSWLAFFAPAGTPKPIIDRLNKELVAALTSEDVKTKLDELALPIVADKPEDLKQLLQFDLDRWGKLVKEMKIEAQ